ncbi:MAG: hypothetical protein GY724_15375 [Actinomycetia bacterium]|nr:hypothetical protein [Actinomycetes bacterium]
MTAVYILAAIVGLPLVAYAILGGDDGDAGEGPDFEDGSIFGYFSLGTLSFFGGFFGLTGLALTAASSGALVTFVLAAIVGVIAAGTQRSLLRYIARTSASSHLSDVDFTGKAATVVVPVEAGRRGQILIQVSGERHQLTAELVAGDHGTLGVGSSVVVVSIEGGIARVSNLDPELA